MVLLSIPALHIPESVMTDLEDSASVLASREGNITAAVAFVYQL